MSLCLSLSQGADSSKEHARLVRATCSEDVAVHSAPECRMFIVLYTVARHQGAEVLGT